MYFVKYFIMKNPLYFDNWKRMKSKLPDIISIIILSILAISFGTIGAYIVLFFQRYYIQSPVIITTRCAVCRKATPTPHIIIKYIQPSPTPINQKKDISAYSENEIIMEQPNGKVLWKIYQLETQRGLTDNCRIKNIGYGGFGVMTDGKVVCYPSFQLAVERANYWYQKILQGRSQKQALCKWSGHGDVNDCTYYNNFLLVND